MNFLKLTYKVLTFTMVFLFGLSNFSLLETVEKARELDAESSTNEGVGF